MDIWWMVYTILAYTVQNTLFSFYYKLCFYRSVFDDFYIVESVPKHFRFPNITKRFGKKKNNNVCVFVKKAVY